MRWLSQNEFVSGVLQSMKLNKQPFPYTSRVGGLNNCFAFVSFTLSPHHSMGNSHSRIFLKKSISSPLFFLPQGLQMFLISIRIKTLLSSNPWKIFSFDECEEANVAALQAHTNIIPHMCFMTSEKIKQTW